MSYSVTDIIFLFFIYSFIGWLWETIYCSIKDKKFAYRGFLVGPYCPVYGFAVTTVLLATQPFQHNLLGLFVSGMLVATIFEFIAAWLLETFFHMKLWDYTNEVGNIKGWIAPRISLFWGFSIVILVKFIQPDVMRLINHLNQWIALGIVCLMTADLIWTVLDTVKFQQAAQAFEKYVRAEQEKLRETVKNEVGDLSKQAEVFSKRLDNLRLHINDTLKEKGVQPFRFNQRRMLRNYKNFSLTTAPFFNELRKQTAALKRKKADKKD
ncbi:hypothetical protein JG537_06150 [Streptococcus sp. SL1232]|uniref:putative ABC transporter permease n=1 Tax=Streptococcus vicugnae TaxID=2740579 RepID=UPI0018F51386|nr:putative ABC transporter permease [Streptococcus vicugnae]MBJ7541297.1 hypothetical protein [Streptococcus vicugnae]